MNLWTNFFDNFYNFCQISMKFCMEVINVGIQLKWTDGIARPYLNHPTHPAKTTKWQTGNFVPILIKLGTVLLVRNSVVDPYTV